MCLFININNDKFSSYIVTNGPDSIALCAPDIIKHDEMKLLHSRCKQSSYTVYRWIRKQAMSWVYTKLLSPWIEKTWSIKCPMKFSLTFKSLMFKQIMSLGIFQRQYQSRPKSKKEADPVHSFQEEQALRGELWTHQEQSQSKGERNLCWKDFYRVNSDFTISSSTIWFRNSFRS